MMIVLKQEMTKVSLHRKVKVAVIFINYVTGKVEKLYLIKLYLPRLYLGSKQVIYFRLNV